MVRRRKLIAVAVAGSLLLVAGGWASIGPLVRGRVAEEAARRHVEVDVGAVHVRWFRVLLTDVHVRPIGVPGVDVVAPEVEIGVSGQLGAREIRVHGARVDVHGQPAEVIRALRLWRGAEGTVTHLGTSEPASALPISVDDASIHWEAAAPELSSLDATGIVMSHDGSGTRVSVADARVVVPDRVVAVSGAAIELDPAWKVRASRLHAVDVAVQLPPSPQELRSDTLSDAALPPVPPPPPAADPKKSAKRELAAVPPLDSSYSPLLPLSDLHALRAKASRLAQWVAAKLPEGLDLAVDALSLKLQKDGATFTAGPGAATILRRGDHLDLRYATEAGASGTPLSLHADLPMERGDVSATVEGGPVSLALLGLEEGVGGLTDVEHATVAGKGRVVLSDEGGAITFDGEVRLRGVGFHRPRIAREVVRGLDLGLSARGSLNEAGELRLDDFGLTMGSLHLGASGALTQKPDQLVVSFRVDLGGAACQSLLESMPSGLLPTLAGSKLAGSFGGHGRIAFDTRKLDDLVLDYKIDDGCKFIEVPAALARERFTKPFQHRVYLPNGATAEQTTGPKTPGWVPLGSIGPYMLVAVQTTEDGAFFRHHGFSPAAIRAALIANLKARKFVRGASTISMQLAKNLFLGREKTLARKLEELILTVYLEQTFTKNEMMELYLNVIEFGPDVYGVGPASYYYFNHHPAGLSLGEALFLSSMLPQPLQLSKLRGSGPLGEGWQRTIEHLMVIANKSGLVSDEDLEEQRTIPVVFGVGARSAAPRARRRDGPGDAADVEWQTTN